MSREPRNEGEQLAADTVFAVEQAIDDWVNSDDCSGYREGELLCIEEQELVNKITIMLSMAIIEISEN